MLQKSTPRLEKMNKIRQALKLKVKEQYREIYLKQIPAEYLEMSLKDFIERFGNVETLTASRNVESSTSSNIPVPSNLPVPKLAATAKEREDCEKSLWRMSVAPDQSDSDHRRITIQGTANGDFEFSMLVPNHGSQPRQVTTNNIGEMSVEELKRLQENLRAAQEHTNQLLASLGV